jgi:hypothetical protein
MHSINDQGAVLFCQFSDDLQEILGNGDVLATLENMLVFIPVVGTASCAELTGNDKG